MSITYETRREAHEAIQPKEPNMEARVLTILRAFGGQTAEEIMARLGTRNPNNVRPRLTGLKKKGLVRASGKKLNAAGHNVAVWEAIEKAAPDGGNIGSGNVEYESKDNIARDGGAVNG